MNSLEARIEFADGRPIVRSTGQSVDAVVQRLEAGESRVRPSAEDPLDRVAALAFTALGDGLSPGPALVQGPPRRPRLAEALSAPALARLFPDASRVALLTLSAGLLQVHDFWNASHEAAQEADDLGERRFSAYWHAIAHRREPDPGNASYWFRRVGNHLLFPALSKAASPLLDEYGDASLTGRFRGAGGWDPSTLIELCTRSGSGTKQEMLARRLQRLEMGVLLAATAEAAAG